MRGELPVFWLGAALLFLLAALLCRQALRLRKQKKELEEMAGDLRKILDEGSSGRLKVFTDDQSLMALAAQVNRLLEKAGRAEGEFCRLESSQKRMLSNISHDVRTPMTVILGYLEILRLHPEKEGELLPKVERKAGEVMELISEFFTLAKLEAGDLPLSLERIDAAELLRKNVLDFYELLKEKDFEVEVRIPDKPVFVKGEEEALGRVLLNLISNAVRYGAEGRYLGVLIREEEELVKIEISDKGKGIGKEFAKNVFDRLFTMEDSRNREIQGNGLGLTIARNLALKMEGDLTLESRPHVLTVFTLSLKRWPQW